MAGTTGRVGRGRARTVALLAAAALLLSLPGPDGAWGLAATAEQVCPEDGTPAPFSDRDAVAGVHLAAVDCVSELGIVGGFVDGTYRPAAHVRRDQLATFLFLALQQAGADLPVADSERFTDVRAGSAHDEAIHRLKAAGITRGADGGGTFAPGERIRRDQMVSFLARGVQFAAPGAIALDEQRPTRFDDVPATSVHSGNVEQAADLGLVQGFDAQTFGPAAATRRDQLAAVVVRFLQVLADRVPDEPEVTLTLVRDRPFTALEDDATATATLRQDGAPVAGAEVSFAIVGGNPVPASGTATTTAEGVAEFVFTSTEVGVVTVTASATHEGQPVTAQVQVAFGEAGTEDVFTLTMEPGPVPEESEVTATATITTASGVPITGRNVSFTTTGAPTSHISVDPATVDGEAHFTFLVTGAGTVTVHARAILDPHHDQVTRTATVLVQ